MKVLILALLAIVATAESQKCEPNSVFKEYCNSCKCSPNGEYAYCTMMACNLEIYNKDGTFKTEALSEEASSSTSVESEEACEPHSTFKDYCNTCKCGSDGKSRFCTLMACDRTVYNKDGTLKTEVLSEEASSSTSVESEEACEPHSTFKDYCNTCKCGSDGKSRMCTLMACDPSVYNKDGTLKVHQDSFSKREADSEESEEACEPHSTFKDYCNTCKCGSDGKSRMCTLMACDPTEYNKDGTLKSKASDESESEESGRVCEPGTTFKDYCNTCSCSADGKNAACTLMACDPRVYNKDGSMKIALESLTEKAHKCEPGKAYSPDGCNTCICSEDGSVSMCTLKLCISNLVRTHSDKDVKRWGPLYKQGDSCTPRESFYSECNMCICSTHGNSAFCTLMDCA